MIVTFAALAAGADAAPDGPEALLAHPVNAVVTMSAPATGARYLYFTEGLLRLVPGVGGKCVRFGRAGAPLRAAGAGRGVSPRRTGERAVSLDGGASVVLGRTPAQQVVLQDGDEGFGDEGDDRDQHHPGQDTVHVEVVLRRADEQPESLVGPEQLADDRADEGEAETDVQAGQDPRERGRQHHFAGHPPR